MTSTRRALLWFGGIVGVLFLMMWYSTDRGHPPRTGRTCVEVLNRIAKDLKRRELTKDEKFDLDDCEP